MELTAEAASEMSRAQALRALATAEGVPPRDRRMAELMLAGPVISDMEARQLSAFLPNRSPVAAAVRRMVYEAAQEHAGALADLRELGLA